VTTTPKRAVRTVKQVGATPCVAACTSCGQQFQAPTSLLRSVKDATDYLKARFDAHTCTKTDAS